MTQSNKIYLVSGIYDIVTSGDLDDIHLWTEYFKTKEEADQACKIVEDFYANKCNVPCLFSVREIDMDNLYTIDQLKKDIEDEYKNCWNLEMEKNTQKKCIEDVLEDESLKDTPFDDRGDYID